MAIHDVLCVCLAVALFPAVFARKGAMSRHQVELKEHYEHLAKVAEFHCDLPQQRLLAVNELLSDFQMRGKAYFPEVTVLYRCDRHTGSCNDGGHKCGPLHADTVKMPFKVTFLEDQEGRKKGEWTMEYHPLENHTSCGCLKYEVPPSKTAVHYHYIDPSLMPLLPLDPGQNTPGNTTSYEVPMYPNTELDVKMGNESFPGEEVRPSIFEMTQMAEEVRKPDEYQGFGGYPGDSSSTSTSTSTPIYEVPDVDECDSCDRDATTIPADLLRFGQDSPRSEAFRSTDIDSPYETLLKQAFS
ncbi:uncharacterized protein LOC129003935 [Macrosteles quadrilineatus]|uniref:uncharacterized protein LOC129003935 n=1 Tax=Macrosteles quadrilineatus TaxID=74068 RepID=UPI0023E13165|nr:uncharacterized protein LOC129003935 [Macrosteles quadrilineatus]